MNYTVNTLISKSSPSAYKGEFAVLVGWFVPMVFHAFLVRVLEMVQRMPVPGQSALTPLLYLRSNWVVHLFPEQNTMYFLDHHT